MTPRSGYAVLNTLPALTLLLAGIATAVHAGDQQTPAFCRVMADRYRPLANSHPGEAPLEVLSAAPDSGVRSGKGPVWEDVRASGLAAWAAAQTPPIVVPQTLVDAVKRYQENGGTTSLTKAPAVDVYSFLGLEGSMACANSLSFVVQSGVALPATTPGEMNEEGGCDDRSVYATVDASPVAVVQHYDGRPGMTASIDLWNWNGHEFAYQCTARFTYKPHFSTKTLNAWGESCGGPACNDLRAASFTLAESAEADPKALRREALARLTQEQAEQFAAMDRLFAKQARDPSSNDAFTVPHPYRGRLFLASIGHFAIGWRNYADWSVVFEELDDGKLLPRGQFPVGTSKGDLVDVAVTSSRSPR